MAVVLSDEVGVVLAVYKVVVAQLYHLFESVVDEDKADKSGEALFCEAREVLHQKAGIRGDEHQAEHARPQANPQPELEVVEIVVSEEKRQKRSGGGRILLCASKSRCFNLKAVESWDSMVLYSRN